jgi:hypothetical protein
MVLLFAEGIPVLLGVFVSVIHVTGWDLPADHYFYTAERVEVLARLISQGIVVFIDRG